MKQMLLKNKLGFQLLVLFLLVCLLILFRWIVVILPRGLSQRSSEIVIGVVFCAGPSASTGNYGDYDKLEIDVMKSECHETLTMIKSVLVSAKLSGARSVDFHIFVDSDVLKNTLKKEIEGYDRVIKDFFEMNIYFYNAFEAIPPGYGRRFLSGPKRCNYVRVFFPDALPEKVKEILYLDTDTIITGDMVKIWNDFKANVTKTKNGTDQLAALIQNSEVFGNNGLEVYEYFFSDIPHVLPRGLNSGVMFMNLHFMRKFNWTRKAVEIFGDPKYDFNGDQQLINVMFHENLDRLTQFPCQYNFQHLHCDNGLSCKTVMSDLGGIYIMHGAGHAFHVKERSHAHLFATYRKFPLGRLHEVEKELFIPLRNYYSEVTNGRANCNGTIGKYLFKQLLTSNENEVLN